MYNQNEITSKLIKNIPLTIVNTVSELIDKSIESGDNMCRSNTQFYIEIEYNLIFQTVIKNLDNVVISETPTPHENVLSCFKGYDDSGRILNYVSVEQCKAWKKGALTIKYKYALKLYLEMYGFSVDMSSNDILYINLK